MGSNFVYLLQIGEAYEGARVLSVHSTWDGALAAAKEHTGLSGKTWKTFPPTPKVHAAWETGCDVLSVSQHYIED